MTLPAVTTGLLRRTSRTQLAVAAAGAAIALAVLVSPRAEPGAAEAPDAAAVLAADAVALHVPQSWLGAPLPPARVGDRVDVFAASADRSAGAMLAAGDARVLSLSADGLVVALTTDDAAALIVARARGYLLVVVLRSR